MPAEDIRTARLIYANRQASKLTDTDLGRLVGKLIFDAFPYLVDTEIPRLYQEVALEKKSHHVGIVDYEDENVKRAISTLKCEDNLLIPYAYAMGCSLISTSWR